MPVYYFVPFIVSNRYLLFWVSNGHNSVTVQNRTHVFMNIFHHKYLGNHLLQLCPKVVKHPVYHNTLRFLLSLLLHRSFVYLIQERPVVFLRWCHRILKYTNFYLIRIVPNYVWMKETHCADRHKELLCQGFHWTFLHYIYIPSELIHDKHESYEVLL